MRIFGWIVFPLPTICGVDAKSAQWRQSITGNRHAILRLTVTWRVWLCMCLCFTLYSMKLFLFIGQCEFKNKGILKTKIVIFLFTEVVRDEGGPVIIWIARVCTWPDQSVIPTGFSLTIPPPSAITENYDKKGDYSLLTVNHRINIIMEMLWMS